MAQVAAVGMVVVLLPLLRLPMPMTLRLQNSRGDLQTRRRAEGSQRASACQVNRASRRLRRLSDLLYAEGAAAAFPLPRR
jgi:hypothetical protein